MNILPLPRSRAPAMAPVDPTRVDVAVSPPMGIPSWSYPGLYGSPFLFIPQGQDLELYENLAKLLPLLTAALTKTTELVGIPYIEAEDDVEADIRDWMETVSSNRVQRGFSNWVKTWILDHFMYGRSHTEAILSPDLREIVALQELHPRTIFLRLQKDTYNLDIVQFQRGHGQPVQLNSKLMFNAIHELRTDNPNGTSLIYGLPFVVEIINKMTRNLGNTWDTYGEPSYHLQYKPPEKMNDPQGLIGRKITSDMLSTLMDILKSRKEGDMKHFATSGEVEIKIIGARGEVMDYSAPLRALEEQVVSRLNLPPMMLGLQWQAGERIGAVQAGLLSARIDNVRETLEPELYRLIELRQVLTGGSTEFKLAWRAPTLQDAMETAKGDLLAAQAEYQRQDNDEQLWRLGVINQFEFARRHREDLMDKTDQEVAALLPDLAATPPEPPPPPAFGQGPAQGSTGAASTGAGAGLAFALNSGEKDSDWPFASLTYGRNGRH